MLFTYTGVTSHHSMLYFVGPPDSSSQTVVSTYISSDSSQHLYSQIVVSTYISSDSSQHLYSQIVVSTYIS